MCRTVFTGDSLPLRVTDVRPFLHSFVGKIGRKNVSLRFLQRLCLFLIGIVLARCLRHVRIILI